MPLYEKLEVDFRFVDERGSLTQLVHRDFSQINVLTTKKGMERGGHFHKVSSEAFYVIEGAVDVTFKRGIEIETARFERGDFFLVKPFITHSMSFPLDCIMLAIYDYPIQNQNQEKDIYSEG